MRVARNERFAGSRWPSSHQNVPVISVALAVVESALLLPSVPQKRALRIGKILFLVIVPAVVLFTGFQSYLRHSFYGFPLGASWLAYPLLWFRIREKFDDGTVSLGAN